MYGPTRLQILVQGVNPTICVGVSNYKLSIQNPKLLDFSRNIKDMVHDMELNYQQDLLMLLLVSYTLSFEEWFLKLSINSSFNKGCPSNEELQFVFWTKVLSFSCSMWSYLNVSGVSDTPSTSQRDFVKIILIIITLTTLVLAILACFVANEEICKECLDL